MAAYKTSLILLLLFCFNLSMAQQSLLKRKINFSAESERLEDVLLGIAQEGGFSFSYNPDFLPVDSLITLNVKNSSIKDILLVLLGSEMELKISGNHLVILRTKYSSSGGPIKKTSVIDGFIKNSSTGVGIANAVVYDVSKLNSALSDDQGYFSLELTLREENVGLAIAKLDFEDTAVVLLNEDQTLNLYLTEVLGNVEVSGTGTDGITKNSNVDNLKVVKLVTPPANLSVSGNLNIYTYKFAQVSFLPFLGTNMRMSGTTQNKVSLNVLAGYSGGTNGVEIGGLFNINRHYAKGVQIAGLGNVVGSETIGAQIAGLFNTNLGEVKGLQIAGINNLVLDTIQGVQLAGISNIAIQNVNGFQISGISNVALKDVHSIQLAGISNFGRNIGGGQIAGIVNTSNGKVKGIQLAGILNSSSTVNSVQIAGIANIATDTVSGFQLATFVNYSKVNRGFQLGIINISDTVPGTSIGLINIVRRGYNKIELASTEVLYLGIRLKFGTKRFYNILGIGTQQFNAETVWGYTYGFGSAIGLGHSSSDLNIELTFSDIQQGRSAFEDINLNTRLNILYALQVAKRIKVFAGPTWSNLIYAEEKLTTEPYLQDIPPYTLYNTNKNHQIVSGWIGLELGVRFF
jgi:hypothetical protein